MILTKKFYLNFGTTIISEIDYDGGIENLVNYYQKLLKKKNYIFRENTLDSTGKIIKTILINTNNVQVLEIKIGGKND